MKNFLPAMSLNIKSFKSILKKNKKAFLSFNLLIVLLVFQTQIFAQGTWTKVAAKAPDPSGGGMLLLSDGTIICKSFYGGTDGIGNIYDKLTPDVHGSYANGTWSRIAPMNDTRLYYSSQVLKDGRVYVAGGEYGSGGSKGETYDPVTNVWTKNPAVGSYVSDANSEILDNGNVLQALVTGNLKTTKLYNPLTNIYSTGPSCIGIHNESVWVKLPDNSILMVDRNTSNSERYIPSLNQWIADATVPVSLYDPYGLEEGAALLLPDGRAFFIGSPGVTAYYTPSGNTSPGKWTAGPRLPNGQGQPDAPAAMMVDGKILMVTSPAPNSGNHFPTPTSFYEFDYLTNTFTRLNSPGGGLTANVSVYVTNMIDLPDGSVMFSYQDSAQYYVYTPGGSPLVAAKPKIKAAKRAGNSFIFTGTQFNGISEGASYGDDWQMSTNYPLVRLTTGNNVFYAKSYNWNATGVQRGNAADTFFIASPVGLPHGRYAVQVVANGIASDALIVNYGVSSQGFASESFAFADASVSNAATNTPAIAYSKTKFSAFPNPAETQTTIQFSLVNATHVIIKLYDINGKEIRTLTDAQMQQGNHLIQVQTANLPAGIYSIRMITETSADNIKLIVK